MGGRGRGRGGARMTFTLEQLGLAPGEALPAPIHQPPPHYPPLDLPPAPLEPTLQLTTQLHHKAAFALHFSRFKQVTTLKNSSASTLAAQIEPDDSHNIRLDFDWTRFPAELRPSAGKKRKATSTSTAIQEKSAKEKNIHAILEELEKKEEVIVKKEIEEDEDEKEVEDHEEEFGDDIDEEMDEGTDYNQNYFDNGENYLEMDDDDDQDDGPIF